MKRLLRPILVAAAVSAVAPAAAQNPQTPRPATPPAATPAPPSQAAPAAVPLPTWFREIDTAGKGEVTRGDFLKHRMKSFEQLDANKDGKLSVDEFLKLAEPPFTPDVPGLPPLEERRARARGEFQNLDTNRDNFVDRPEAEALVHAEFNQYDTDRDNKVTEPELRLIVQRSMQREAATRQQAEARQRQSVMAINDFIDMQLRSADQLDKNADGKVSQQEYVALAGPADGPQTQGMPPFDLRRRITMVKFQEIDTNKDGQLDRVELTAYAVNQFMTIDVNKDRFLNEEEFKKAQEAEQAKLRALMQTMQPAQQPPRPAPAQGGQPRPAPANPAPSGLAPGLPQGTR